MAEIRVFVVVIIIIAATTITITTVLIMAALRNRAGYYIYAPWFLLSSSFFLFSSPNLSGRRLDVYHTSTHGTMWPYANVECTSETCYTQLAGNAGPKKTARKSPSGHHRTTLSGYIFATEARINNRKKQQYLPTRLYNIVNFGPLAADIVSLV